MSYGQFISYNVIGGIAWVSLFLLAGYFFGNIPAVKHNFSVVIMGIIAVSVLPMIVEVIKNRKNECFRLDYCGQYRGEPGVVGRSGNLISEKEKLNQWLLGLVSLSAGGMMGVAFLNLLPEAIKSLGAEAALGWVLGSFSGFFFWKNFYIGIIAIIKLQRLHVGLHEFGGDSIHNLIDGLVIAATFVASVPLGIATTMAVALHEIPQEIGDFGVLVYSGWSRKKALIANLVVALVSVIGGVMGYFWQLS